MARGEEYKSKDRSTNLNSHLIKAFVKCLKDDFRMFVQFQGDGKESLDKEYTRYGYSVKRTKTKPKRQNRAWE
ncbi:hypothetical protein Tco_0336194 [Tanacetum coccineum]